MSAKKASKKTVEELSCDRCVHPGACCKLMVISDKAGGFCYEPTATADDIRKDMASKWLPFEPVRPDFREVKRGDKLYWWFTCPKVTPEGRCSIYENRPGLCRAFNAGDDPLCVHYRDTDGAPILPQIPIL